MYTCKSGDDTTVSQPETHVETRVAGRSNPLAVWFPSLLPGIPPKATLIPRARDSYPVAPRARHTPPYFDCPSHLRVTSHDAFADPPALLTRYHASIPRNVALAGAAQS
ncbi:hypothetical protein EVG20_g2516 [Dentipellis fragilis]|uniref:Uncharacterized protein n=1 Tax=Dentipellis fragilis TaxID=205917 RepID=A0A4Y9ZAR4_9AGAM|nr:hypothetical protein EVG20_g2516 [Dentipellis fragilis]